MSSSERQRERGKRSARAIMQSLGQELLEARLAAGLSQAFVAQAAGLTQSRISRTERDLPPAPRVDELCRHCAALGLRLSARAYPEASPVRDAAHLELLAALRAVVSARFRWRTEVPLGIEGDLRAWDAVLEGPGQVVIDAETRLRDLQALQRRLELKLRDSGSPRLVLAISGTEHNRRVVREHRAALASTLPLGSHETLAALRAGEVPRANGFAFLRASATGQRR